MLMKLTQTPGVDGILGFKKIDVIAIVPWVSAPVDISRFGTWAWGGTSHRNLWIIVTEHGPTSIDEETMLAAFEDGEYTVDDCSIPVATQRKGIARSRKGRAEFAAFQAKTKKAKVRK